MATTNPTVRIININGSGGAFVPISASAMARHVEIEECQLNDATAFNPQGLDCQKPEDQYATSIVYQPGETIYFGDPIPEGNAAGPIIGFPEQNAANGTNAWNYIAAAIYCKLRSATVTATYVRVTEWS